MGLAWYCVATVVTFFASVVLLRPRRSSLLFVAFLHAYHFLNSWLFLIYSSGQVTDSENYSIWAGYGWMPVSVGTPSIVNMVRALVEVGVTRYSSQMLVFSALSCVGLVAAYVGITKSSVYRRHEYRFRWPIATAFLLPGLHFWTSPIGKDAIIMFASGIFLWCLSEGRRSFYPLAMLMVALVFLARPHVGACLALAAMTALYLKWSASGVVAQKALVTSGYVGLSRDSCGNDLIMPLSEPAMDCVADA